MTLVALKEFERGIGYFDVVYKNSYEVLETISIEERLKFLDPLYFTFSSLYNIISCYYTLGNYTKALEHSDRFKITILNLFGNDWNLNQFVANAKVTHGEELSSAIFKWLRITCKIYNELGKKIDVLELINYFKIKSEEVHSHEKDKLISEMMLMI